MGDLFGLAHSAALRWWDHKVRTLGEALVYDHRDSTPEEREDALREYCDSAHIHTGERILSALACSEQADEWVLDCCDAGASDEAKAAVRLLCDVRAWICRTEGESWFDGAPPEDDL